MRFRCALRRQIIIVGFVGQVVQVNLTKKKA